MKTFIITILAALSISTAAIAAGTHEGGFNPAEWVIPTDVTPSAPSEKQYDR